jgi:triacylglycerol lipase
LKPGQSGRPKGRRPFVPIGYSAFSLDIRTAARGLGDQVELVCARSAGRPVVLNGHSLSGLIARYYVQRLGRDAFVPLVITLATPHGGTATVSASAEHLGRRRETALLASPHPLLRQLRPGTELLIELAELTAG